MGVVSLFYAVANLSYLSVLPIDGVADAATPVLRGIQFAREDRVGTAVAEVIFGQSGAAIMALAIMLFSAFGCNNGLILAGARVYYAMAKDGLFFSAAGKVNDRHAPAVAARGADGVGLRACASRDAPGQLSDFIVFAVLVFYILTITGRSVCVAHPDADMARLIAPSAIRYFRRSILCGPVHRCRSFYATSRSTPGRAHARWHA